MSIGEDSEDPPRPESNEFILERYKYLLQQINSLNENVYRFLAIYQTLTTALVGGGLALFVGHEKWRIQPSVARSGMIGLMMLVTLVATFTILLIIIGILNWLDYRREECELSDIVIAQGFREPPKVRNFIRWHETYVILFIVTSVAFLWILVVTLILPSMR